MSEQPERRMTLRELKAALDEFYEDTLDAEVKIEDQFGATAYITEVADANGPFIHPSLDFEQLTPDGELGAPDGSAIVEHVAYQYSISRKQWNLVRWWASDPTIWKRDVDPPVDPKVWEQ